MLKAKDAKLIQSCRVGDTTELTLNAMTLQQFLNSHHGRALDLTYVQDTYGNTFTRVSLVKERLTDGSIVNNLVLS